MYLLLKGPILHFLVYFKQTAIDCLLRNNKKWSKPFESETPTIFYIDIEIGSTPYIECHFS